MRGRSGLSVWHVNGRSVRDLSGTFETLGRSSRANLEALQHFQ